MGDDLQYARATLRRWIHKTPESDPKVESVVKALALLDEVERPLPTIVTIAGLAVDV